MKLDLWNGMKCKCRLDAIVCNNKQRWNKNKCRCECKELIDKGICDKGFIWNPSNYECECVKNCDFSEYLDYESCKFRKKLLDKLIDEWAETIEEVKLAEITIFGNENKNKYGSFKVYIVLMIVVFQFLLELLFILFITIGLWLKMFLALNVILTKKQKFGKSWIYKWEK